MPEIFQHFYPSAADPRSVAKAKKATLNSSEENPNGVAFLMVWLDHQLHWSKESTVYAKSNLDLLPDYADQKAQLIEQHAEPTPEEQKIRIRAKLTESIQFDRYGLEDGPDMECLDEHGNAIAMIVPGDYMPVCYELPEIAPFDTPTVKYWPAKEAQQPIAAFGNVYGSRGFEFLEWVFIEQVELFAANSVALACLMRDKHLGGDVTRDWAAVKVCKIDKGEPEWRPELLIPPSDTSSDAEEKEHAEGHQKEGKGNKVAELAVEVAELAVEVDKREEEEVGCDDEGVEADDEGDEHGK